MAAGDGAGSADIVFHIGGDAHFFAGFAAFSINVS